MTRTATLLAALVALAPAGVASAQSLGTYRWQLQPYCNVVTVAVTQIGSVYRLEGTDDRCGANSDQASVTGVAYPNPDGSIGFGMTIVTPPLGVPVHVYAEIGMSTLSGNWRDTAGALGAFRFTTGAGTGGSPRPDVFVPVPLSITMTDTGSLVARGDRGVGAAPASGAGVRMMWYPGKAAFRAGEVFSGSGANAWDDVNIGLGSAAFGRATRATNEASTAMGHTTTASGRFSTAMGSLTVASGTASTATGDRTTASFDGSTAMGMLTVASNLASTALGNRTFASGPASTSMGVDTVASGAYSLAGGSGSRAGGIGALAYGQLVFANGDGSVVLGSNAVAVAGAFGSFVFADRSTSDQLFSLSPNEFVVRAAGGITFFSNAAGSAGVAVAPGGGSWSSVSDVHMKEHFRDLDGNEVLARISRMPVREWSYKTQDASIRHMGPTAQDFRAAFGLGESDVRINTIDADGVALAAVRALEARTRELRDENTELREALADLRRELDGLKARQRR
ncbi:MAG: tail fiber domain-containing protein [Acidobacteriota bacterium]|nr:tail fiber domain-containing protein [Acidobacteriota bacterium]